MNIQYKNIGGVLLVATLMCISCKKGWLDVKPQQSLAEPSNIEDYQALLDNAYSKMNTGQPGLQEISSGDYYVTSQTWGTLDPIERNALIWKEDIYAGAVNISDWNFPYSRIQIANIVLEGIDNISPRNGIEQIAWENVKGSAYFIRGYNHYTIAQLFCKPYINISASSDLGIPLRLSANFNEISKRASVQQTYSQIINDLQTARSLLTNELPNDIIGKVRPTITAANAMLARVYLSMGEYDSALNYSNKCLQVYNELMNYNENTYVNPGSALTPIKRFNPEVIYTMNLITYSSFVFTRLIVDSTLYNAYIDGDIRKKIFFRPSGTNFTFRGNYHQSPSGLFSGLATDEVYLIRAECNARKNNLNLALDDLNHLLQKRWDKNQTYTPITAIDQNDAINKILLERRKELCFRGIRWTDLRRLNMDPQFSTTLTSIINNQSYTLPPNDPRYVFAIPENVIKLSGIQQNLRN